SGAEHWSVQVDSSSRSVEPVCDGSNYPSMEGRNDGRRFLEGLIGCPVDEVRLRPLGGGLVASAVTHATARYRDTEGRIRSVSCVLKAIEGNAAREGRIYEHLWGCGLEGFAPVLWGVGRDGDRRLLCLQAIRPAERWPWRNLSFAQQVLRVLATLHMTPLSAEMKGILSTWDYERELAASAERSLKLLEQAYHEHRIIELRGYGPALRRVVGQLGELRRRLLGFAPLGQAMIHGDVHSGNVMIHKQGGQLVPVLLDWGRARVGSPLEDVSSWLQNLGYWEPQAKRRHDTLLGEYLSVCRPTLSLGREMRKAYWLAAASNALGGALCYHLQLLLSPGVAARKQLLAFHAASDALRVIRRADAWWNG
ncbi:MAG: aminoglycoside phosphotransferase family protein, partial [Bacillota bacterium]